MKSISLIQSFTIFSTQGEAQSQEDFVLGKKERGLFVVADGFGGAGVGSKVSQTACEAVLGFLEKEAGDVEATLPFVLRSYFSLAGNVLFNALIHANRKVSLLNRGKSLNEKGGASVLAAFLDEDLFALGSVGGCTAWLIRNGKMTELMTPRTYARLCDPFAADPDPQLAAPLMAMGMADDLEPEIVEFRVKPGDRVLLHSDGLREMVRTKLLQAQSVEECLRAETFQDNASLALIQF
jgi:serine/threonine protein phosphatase PrpC